MKVLFLRSGKPYFYVMWIRFTSVFDMSFVPLPFMSSYVIKHHRTWGEHSARMATSQSRNEISRYPLEWQAFFFLKRSGNALLKQKNSWCHRDPVASRQFESSWRLMALPVTRRGERLRDGPGISHNQLMEPKDCLVDVGCYWCWLLLPIHATGYSNQHQ